VGHGLPDGKAPSHNTHAALASLQDGHRKVRETQAGAVDSQPNERLAGELPCRGYCGGVADRLGGDTLIFDEIVGCFAFARVGHHFADGSSAAAHHGGSDLQEPLLVAQVSQLRGSEL